MPSSSPDEGSKLSRHRRWIAKSRSKISKSTVRSWRRLKSLQRPNSRSAAISSSSYSDRLTSLTQSAKHYPRLEELAGIMTDLYSNAVDVKIGQRSVEILEAVAETVAEAIPDPSQISLEMCMKISHLTMLFREINISLGPPTFTIPPHLKLQLDATYSELVVGKKPRTLRTTTRQIFRVFSVASVVDISTTTLWVIDQASDAFPPLKSAVGGVLALNDVTQGVNAFKTRAQQLRQEIFDILDFVPSDSIDFVNNLERLRRQLLQLDKLSRQSFFTRLKNFNRNNEFLSTLQTNVKHIRQRIKLIQAFPRTPRKRKRRRKPPESLQFPRTRALYVFFAASSAFF
ncbi:hypothetical protein K435DRAFT_862465 [Dendrothele bispora CBS 962.96]|uniref:Fungal STAND N-terminal Goodbye domain-containing protein n=1 Tax=Dendrothele bispora (strain CBS 962.96) TaxID=1314807 RepID=A0A4S8LSJ8_DENBC|nr:hypothetical protein K435DRAFT_862465 [Dendrothele bispora CBS 962.96]